MATQVAGRVPKVGPNDENSDLGESETIFIRTALWSSNFSVVGNGDILPSALLKSD
jgi:hypothetical protein